MVKNSTIPRTHEAISLGPSGNLQQTNKLLCLKTGLVLKQRVSTVVLMSDLVIKNINQWGEMTKRE